MRAFDEMWGAAGREGATEARESYRRVADWLAHAPPELLEARRKQAELFSAASASPSTSMATPRRGSG